MRARQGVMHNPLFSEPQLESLYPVIDETGSDSGMLDNALQFYSVTSSRSLPEALATMVPETWEKDELMDRDRRAFYEYYSSVQEPWDGPALLAFTDARFAGAVLDRNGLRPARILELKDGRVILASEVRPRFAFLCLRLWIAWNAWNATRWNAAHQPLPALCRSGCFRSTPTT